MSREGALFEFTYRLLLLCIYFFMAWRAMRFWFPSSLFRERVYARVNCMLTAAVCTAAAAAATATATVARVNPEKRAGLAPRLLFSVSPTERETHTPGKQSHSLFSIDR